MLLQSGAKSIEYITWIADPKKIQVTVNYKNKLKLVTSTSEITDAHFIYAGITGKDTITISKGLSINSSVAQEKSIWTEEMTLNLPDTFLYYTYGGTGNDTIIGGKGNDHIEGGHGDDTLKGGDGDDTLFTNQGDDQIEGGAGNDHIIQNGTGTQSYDGGSGNDTLTVNTDFGGGKNNT